MQSCLNVVTETPVLMLVQVVDQLQSAQGAAVVTSELRLCDPLTPGNGTLRLIELWAENAFASLGMLNCRIVSLCLSVCL